VCRPSAQDGDHENPAWPSAALGAGRPVDRADLAHGASGAADAGRHACPASGRRRRSCGRCRRADDRTPLQSQHYRCGGIEVTRGKRNLLQRHDFRSTWHGVFE